MGCLKNKNKSMVSCLVLVLITMVSKPNSHMFIIKELQSSLRICLNSWQFVGEWDIFFNSFYNSLQKKKLKEYQVAFEIKLVEWQVAGCHAQEKHNETDKFDGILNNMPLVFWIYWIGTMIADSNIVVNLPNFLCELQNFFSVLIVTFLYRLKSKIYL